MNYLIREISVLQLLEWIKVGKIELHSFFRRNFIWSTRDQKLLIDSVSKGYPLPNFFIYRNAKGGYDMVDGQQRATTICKYVKNEFPDSKKRYYKDIDQDKFMSYKLSVTEICDVDESAGESLEELMGRINQIKDEIAKESNVCLDFDKITQDYFGDLFGNSRKIGINNNIRQGDGFYFIHYEEWSWPIHFEWLPLSVDKLMFEKNYTLYLHIEGNLVPFKKYILEDEEYKQLVKSIGGKINNRDKVTAFQKQYIADKPFVDMTYDEKKVFLESAYGEVTPMISIIDRLLKAYKSKESDKISK